ncbi:hypothetical protein HNQ00_002012 [Flavobacterium sp. 14A]|nr:hypothetical protein [Flavobacterium sp. 14A]
MYIIYSELKIYQLVFKKDVDFARVSLTKNTL